METSQEKKEYARVDVPERKSLVEDFPQHIAEAVFSGKNHSSLAEREVCQSVCLR